MAYPGDWNFCNLQDIFSGRLLMHYQKTAPWPPFSTGEYRSLIRWCTTNTSINRLDSRNVFINSENYLPYNFIMNELSWRSHWSGDQIRSMLLEQSDAFWQRDTGIEREKLVEVKQAAPLPMR